MAKSPFFVGKGTQAKDKNFVLPLVNGDEAWRYVKNHIVKAEKSIHLCFWMLNGELEMIRDPKDTFKEPSKRSQNTLMHLLKSKQKAGVKIRILLWDIPTIPHSVVGPSVYDLGVRLSGKTGSFEVMYQPHPSSTIGSWHQKTIILDDQIAFVGGMNAKENDWDTAAHAVYDHRRNPHDMKASRRKEKKRKHELPDFPPRQDYMTLLMGEAVADVQANFVERWNHCISQKCDYYKYATKLPMPKPSRGFSTVPAQVSRTMPHYPPTPTGENGIYLTYQKAVRLAKNYIYIEDQNFRSQALASDIALACKKNKKLRVIVVTPPDNPSDLEQDEKWKVASPSSYWTAKACATIRKVVRDFCLFYLQVSAKDKSGKLQYYPIDLHAKIMIVDDLWYTIGSCNINDRGFQTEGEINLSVSHESAKDLRKRVFAQNLGVECPDKIEDALKLWFAHAKANHLAWKKHQQAQSRVFSYNQKGPLLPIVPRTWF
jgi:phospholipase D1/2